MVDELLGAVALVAWCQRSAGSKRVEAGLKASCLSVVVNVVDDHPPFAFDVAGSEDLGVLDVRGAEVPFWTSPVSEIIGGGPCRSPRIEGVVEGLLLGFGDGLYQVISRLVSNVGILLGEEVVFADGTLDLIGWVVGILQAEVVGAVGSAGGSFSCVAVTIGGGVVVLAIVWGWWVVVATPVVVPPMVRKVGMG